MPGTTRVCVCVCLKLRHIALDSGDNRIMCQDSILHACPSGPISSCSQLFLSASYFLIGTRRSSAGSNGAQHSSLCCFDACWVLVHPLHPLQNMHDSQVAGALKKAWGAIMESSLLAVWFRVHSCGGAASSGRVSEASGKEPNVLQRLFFLSHLHSVWMAP